MKYKIGEEHTSNNFGKYMIKDIVNGKYVIIFLETGYILKNITGGRITNGTVKDYKTPSVCGVGYIGKRGMETKYPKEYQVWRDMLRRCYDEDSNRYNSYGEIGVYVVKSWHNFLNFINDIKVLSGWNIDKFKNGEIQLDKDYFGGINNNNKVYSKETCIWVDNKKNSRLLPTHQRFFKGISPNKVIYYHFNITEFCNFFKELKCGYVSRVLKGERKSCFGWQFEYISEIPEKYTYKNINEQFKNCF